MAVTTGHELQQKDNLCGPFWAARVLRELGFDTDEDTVALAAGTTLADRAVDSVPPGAVSRTDYAHELPTAPPAAAGTAADGLAAAIEELSAGAVRAVPLRGDWTPERVERVVEAAPTPDTRLLANVRTGAFWGTRPSIESLVAELAGHEVEGPAAEWDVGHFCELTLLLRGPAGALVLVHDSYPTFGIGARHLQPPRAVAAALNRGDGREGGILAIVTAERAGAVEQLAHETGLAVEFWDNGSRR